MEARSGSLSRIKSLSDEERKIYEWQMWVEGFGETGQSALKNASVLISRCGGLGGVVAYELAAAGIGHMVIAHAGKVKPSDLNRQLLMTHDWIGKPRIESIRRRLAELNPFLEIETVDANVSSDNVGELVSQVDLVIDCAPLFEERFLMNREAVAQGKPMIECAMYELEAHITSILPGATPCLNCLYPERPDYWKRQFPVFGAVSGTVGCMGAMEAIKILSGIGKPLYGRLLMMNLSDMSFQSIQIFQNPQCPTCGQSRREPV